MIYPPPDKIMHISYHAARVPSSTRRTRVGGFPFSTGFRLDSLAVREKLRP